MKMRERKKVIHRKRKVKTNEGGKIEKENGAASVARVVCAN